MTAAPEDRPLDTTPVHTSELPATPQRDRNIPASAWVEAPAELRNLGDDELGAKARDLTDQLFRMRIQKSMGQLENPDKLRTVRRDLARVKTVLREKTAG